MYSAENLCPENTSTIYYSFSTVELHSTALVAFKQLTKQFLQEFQTLSDVGAIRKWLESYFNDEIDDNLDFSASTVDFLFSKLESSSAFNCLNPKILEHLANKSGIKKLADSVRHYEERFLNRKVQDLFPIKGIKIVGKYITSEEDAESVAALVEQEITIRQLQHMCVPRLLNGTLTLDCGSHSPSFYLSYKVIN